MKDILMIVVTIIILFIIHNWNQTSQINNFYLAEGLSAASNVKIHINEYYNNTGEFPKSNKDMSLPAPETFAGQSLTAVKVSEGGIISIKYDEKSGVKDGIIQLIPNAANSPMGIQWKCVSPSYLEISQFIPGCIYVPGING